MVIVYSAIQLNSLSDAECWVGGEDYAGQFRMWFGLNLIFFSIFFLCQATLFILMLINKDNEVFRKRAKYPALIYAVSLVLILVWGLYAGNAIRFSDEGNQCSNGQLKAQGAFLESYVHYFYATFGVALCICCIFGILLCIFAIGMGSGMRQAL